MRYAIGTHVGVSRSREQISALLGTWGAKGVQWTDEFIPVPKTTLRFIWIYEGIQLMARFDLKMDRKRLEKEAIDGRSNRVSQKKLEKVSSQWMAEAHRLLFILLKGLLNAVDAGIIKAEQVFMPWMEDQNGQVLGELYMSRIKEMPNTTVRALLGNGNE